MACNFAPHNLREVAQAIYDYIDGKEPMLPGPDFPTGGIVINKDDIPAIMKELAERLEQIPLWSQICHDREKNQRIDG